MNVRYSLRKKLRAYNNPDLGWSVMICVFETTGNGINQQIFTMCNTVKPRSTDTCLIRTTHYCGHPLNMDTSLLWTPAWYGHLIITGKEIAYIFSKFNLLNTGTLLIQTLSMAPSVSVLTEFGCTWQECEKVFSSYVHRSVTLWPYLWTKCSSTLSIFMNTS